MKTSESVKPHPREEPTGLVVTVTYLEECDPKIPLLGSNSVLFDLPSAPPATYEDDSGGGGWVWQGPLPRGTVKIGGGYAVKIELVRSEAVPKPARSLARHGSTVDKLRVETKKLVEPGIRDLFLKGFSDRGIAKRLRMSRNDVARIRSLDATLPKSGRKLATTSSEREQILKLAGEGTHSHSQIATMIGRARGTVERVLMRKKIEDRRNRERRRPVPTETPRRVESPLVVTLDPAMEDPLPSVPESTSAPKKRSPRPKPKVPLTKETLVSCVSRFCDGMPVPEIVAEADTKEGPLVGKLIGLMVFKLGGDFSRPGDERAAVVWGKMSPEMRLAMAEQAMKGG